jgi:aspartate kinase
MHSLIVKKYGGATLADPQKIKSVAQKVAKQHFSGVKIVVVVSAMGQTTNNLIQLAHQVSDRPALRELDMLLTAGERISMSLLSIALNDLGCPAISFTGSQAGILTDDSHINAQIVEVRAQRVQQALAENKVVILAGFQGMSRHTKEITTLGRGGSDITAVAISSFLKADRCEILKDVAGVYSADPKLVENAQLQTELSYDHLHEMTSWGAKVLHQQSVEMAANNNVTLLVGAAADDQPVAGTIITTNYKTPAQKILAINSFEKIMEIEWSKNFHDLNNFFNENQIGQCTLLHIEGGQRYFITAPNETLQSISYFSKHQDTYQIISEDISTVSVTHSLEISDQTLNDLQNNLNKNNIEVIVSFNTQYSSHFFVHQKQRSEAIRILHSLIS